MSFPGIHGHRPKVEVGSGLRNLSKEGEQQTVLLWWELAQFIAPKFFRIAFFSFTMFVHEEAEPETSDMIAVLHKQLHATEFGVLQGWE